MAYQPTFPQPYMEAIDVKKQDGNEFKCLINPKDTVETAEIIIYQNDAETEPVKTVSLNELSPDTFPFIGGMSDDSWLTCEVDGEGLANGVDYKWQMKLQFSDTLGINPAAENLEVWNMFNQNNQRTSNLSEAVCFAIGFNEDIYAGLQRGTNNTFSFNGQDYKIDFFKKHTYDDYINNTRKPCIAIYPPKDSMPSGMVGNTISLYSYMLTPEYYFKARTEPILSINELPDPIDSSSYTFEATYSQAENVGIAYFEYNLYRDYELVATSGQVFSQQIKYTFPNLADNSNYSIELTVVNNDGVELKAEEYFDVRYTTLRSHIDLEIEPNNDSAYINVDFSKATTIPATIDGEVNLKSYNNPELVEVANGYVMDYTPETTTVLTIQPYSNIKVGMIVRIGNEDKTVISFGDSDTELVLDSAFTAAPTAGTPYTIYTAFNGISLAEDQSIIYDRVNDKDLYIPTDSTQVIHWHGKRGFNGKIFEKSDTSVPSQSVWAEYDGERFNYQIGRSYGVSTDIYLGRESAIAGSDSVNGHSIIRAITPSGATYSITVVNTVDGKSVSGLILDGTEVIEGSTIQVGTNYAIITQVEASGSDITLTLDRYIDTTNIDECVVYNDNYIYELDDSNELDDGEESGNPDILVDSDLTNKYWWRITATPNDVEFEKTVPFIESEV